MKKVLLDENLPHELRYYIPGHDVRTARFERWDGIDNGDLLNLAVDDGFDVMVTMDARIPRDHNIAEARHRSYPSHGTIEHNARLESTDIRVGVPSI